MAPNHDKPKLPVTSDSALPAVQDGSKIQRAPGFLPRGDSIQIDEKIAIAHKEGYSPLAIELAIGSDKTSATHKLLIIGFAIIALALVAFLFPVNRFFKPETRDLGTMTIGAPISEGRQALLGEYGKPWLKVLLEMDRLYFREGKLTEAIEVAEKNLAQVPEQNWEDWKKVHYRYWELLADAGRNLQLSAATQSYLQILPEDPFAVYYTAHAFLAVVDRIQSFNRERRLAYRSQADALIAQIDRTGKALQARQKSEDAKSEKAYLQNLYQKLRLQEARLYILIWRLGGYKEDNHPDVKYRDQALDIISHNGLADIKEAKALKIEIYRHILERWYWFEGQQVIQGIRQKRRALVEALDRLQKELKDAETL